MGLEPRRAPVALPLDVLYQMRFGPASIATSQRKGEKDAERRTRRRRRPSHQHHQSPRGTPPRSPRRTAPRRRSSSSARSCRQNTNPRARGRGPGRWTTIAASASRRRASPGRRRPSRAPLACRARYTPQPASRERDRTPTAPGRRTTTCCPPPHPLARRPPYLRPPERVNGRPRDPSRRSAMLGT